jgi:hypothetical protein
MSIVAKAITACRRVRSDILFLLAKTPSIVQEPVLRRHRAVA